jgi:exopolysaccharide biosynthesis predicted pyruvyltransferase EpsI
MQQSDATDIRKNVASGLGLPSTDALDSDEGRTLSKKKVTFMWREDTSYKEALRLYPFVSNRLVPDMAFELGPYAPIRSSPDKLVDITVFLREDRESKVSERTRDFVQSILPNKDLTFELVDWNSRLAIFNTSDYFFTDSSIKLISMGKVMVCDRLHAAILGYLTGIPFVYVDQSYGKITKTLYGSLGGVDGCMDGEASRWAKASNLEEALAMAAQMITEN